MTKQLETLFTDTYWPYPQVSDNFKREQQNPDYEAPWVEIGEDEYNWFENCLPPLGFDHRSFLNSEPYSFNSLGQDVYLGAIRYQGIPYAKLLTFREYQRLCIADACFQRREICNS